MEQLNDLVRPALGGIFIGLSATLLLGLLGRIAGISGILAGILRWDRSDLLWRILFVVGIWLGAGVIYSLTPEVIQPASSTNPLRIILAGFLVGFGTLLGNGCTSGHGVCGISRMSVRSVIATLAFMGSAMITVYLTR